jgi:ArsR family transcriptional regulator
MYTTHVECVAQLIRGCSKNFTKILRFFVLNIIECLYNYIIVLEVQLMPNDDCHTYERVSEQFKLLSDKSRLHLLALLAHGELCVCDLVSLTKFTQPNVSQHMRKLKTGGLVSESKKGQWVYYSLKENIPPFVLEIIRNLPSREADVQSLKSSADDCCAVESVQIGGLRAEKISS